MGRTVSAHCARCGHDRSDLYITAIGIDHDVAAVDGKYLLHPGAIEEPDTVQIEAICTSCGHARFIDHNTWEWA